MRASFAAFILCCVASVLSAADGAQVERELKDVHVLDRALNEQGIDGLLATSLPCPLVRSQYAVERLVLQDSGIAVFEEKKRRFGLNLAKALEKTAEQMQVKVSSEERVRQVTTLLRLAEWLKSAQGYGNYILLSRCEGIATVPLAYVTADLSFPFEDVKALYARLQTNEADRKFRVAILNSEAPTSVAPAQTLEDLSQDQQLEAYWQSGWREMQTWLKKKQLRVTDASRDDLPEGLAFFLDDHSATHSVVSTWDIKNHLSIIYGRRDSQIRNVSALIFYREQVGAFPTNPPSWWKPNADPLDTAIRAAFEYSWRPFLEKFGPIYGRAAVVYEQVITGSFNDQETQERLIEHGGK